MKNFNIDKMIFFKVIIDFGKFQNIDLIWPSGTLYGQVKIDDFIADLQVRTHELSLIQLPLIKKVYVFVGLHPHGWS